jgi:hypothetical protein
LSIIRNEFLLNGEKGMAGDIGILETLVAPSTGAAAAAAAGPVLHEYGPSIQVRIGAPPAAAAAPINESALSENERLGLSALKLRESPEYRAEKERRPYREEAWSRGPSPLHPNEEAIVNLGNGAGGEPGRATGGLAPLATRLAGRVAVGVIMVSGPGALALTDSQRTKIAAEVQNGLSWLGAQSPAKDVTWVHNAHHVTVNVPPAAGTPGGNQWEHFEAPWRDAALAQLGFPAGPAGVNFYIDALRKGKAANAAYCAFFTHYPLNHFAYCTGPYLVMQFANDGWGPENLDSVFAHESGHVFGAPDEYQESGCNCGGSHGFFRKPNVNCESCAPSGGVNCIMKRNSWAMCSMTPYHLGFNGLPSAAPALAAHVA